MAILHECPIADHGKATDFVCDLTCKHCGRDMVLGDALTSRHEGYFNRGEYRVCTPDEAYKE